jgi:nitroreductase
MVMAMDVIDAIINRHSQRAFLSRAVERDVIVEILSAAARSPSWGNSQPWEVFVATGGALERIKSGYAQNYAGKVVSSPESPHPGAWPEAVKNRQQRLYPDMVRDCGEDVGKFGQFNQELFHAPAVAYICMDKMLGEWSMYDLGAYSQSFMLAALAKGLGSIPAITLTLYPDILRRELGIPDHLRITIGIAFGYIDPDNKLNNFVSSRSPLDDTVRIVD